MPRISTGTAIAADVLERARPVSQGVVVQPDIQVRVKLRRRLSTGGFCRSAYAVRPAFSTKLSFAFSTHPLIFFA